MEQFEKTLNASYKAPSIDLNVYDDDNFKRKMQKTKKKMKRTKKKQAETVTQEFKHFCAVIGHG